MSALLKAPYKADEEHTIFDPSNLVERKFFNGSSKEICSYRDKYFINGLAFEKRLEMVKHHKRPRHTLHEGAKTGQPLSAQTYMQ